MSDTTPDTRIHELEQTLKQTATLRVGSLSVSDAMHGAGMAHGFEIARALAVNALGRCPYVHTSGDRCTLFEEHDGAHDW